ncbi:MAG: HD domain-containing phosphohydrolase, partial [Pseudomonadota bacterium]
PATLHSVVAAALTMNACMLHEAVNYEGNTLTGAERAALRRHPLDGADLLRAAGVADPDWLDCVLMHHENDDGSGYPEGKIGDAVPRSARLIALADRYCAYVSARNYRRSLLPQEALRKLREEHPGAADAALVSLFETQLGATPPGTLVRLDGGALAVVARRADASGALGLHLLLEADGASSARRCSSGEPDCAIGGALHEDEAGVRFSMKSVWGELAAL